MESLGWDVVPQLHFLFWRRALTTAQACSIPNPYSAPRREAEGRHPSFEPGNDFLGAKRQIMGLTGEMERMSEK